MKPQLGFKEIYKDLDEFLDSNFMDFDSDSIPIFQALGP